MGLNLKDLLARKGGQANDDDDVVGNSDIIDALISSGKLSKENEEKLSDIKDVAKALKRLKNGGGAMAIGIDPSDTPVEQLQSTLKQVIGFHLKERDLDGEEAISAIASLYYSLIDAFVAPSKMQEFLDAINPAHELAYKRLLAVAKTKTDLGYEDVMRKMAKACKEADERGAKLDDKLAKKLLSEYSAESEEISERAKASIPKELEKEIGIDVTKFMLHHVTGKGIIHNKGDD